MKSNKAVLQVMPGQDDQDLTIASHMREVLLKLGENPSREGLVRTPERAEKALKFLTSGYEMDLEKIVNGALFTHKCDEMVIVKDIEFFSMCEHHLLPFFGKIHVAYLPKDKVIGLSKIPRIVDMFARRLQIAGAPDAAGGRNHSGRIATARRWRRLRSPPLLHDDARRGEAALGHDDQRDARRFPRSKRNPQ